MLPFILFFLFGINESVADHFSFVRNNIIFYRPGRSGRGHVARTKIEDFFDIPDFDKFH